MEPHDKAVPRLLRQLEVGGFRVDDVLYPPHYRQPRHAHQVPGISLVLAGQLREGVGRVEEDAQPLSIVVKPARVIHTDEIGPAGARLLQIAVRDDRSWQRLPMGRWRWLHTGTGLRRMLRILRDLQDDTAGVEDGVLELLAELGEPDPPDRRPPPFWLRLAREVLDDFAADQLSVRQLADQVGVHPVSLTRAFRRHYRLSVSAYRRHVRLRQAAGAMGRRNLSCVAQEAGYADHAHLCRDMRALTGLTPSEYRRLTNRV